MNDFLSSIWIYFFSFCLSFQLNCSSHLLRRSERSPPNLASEADGIPWSLSVDNSSFGYFFGMKNAWNRCGASAYIISEQARCSWSWNEGQVSSTPKHKERSPETKAATELYILWKHHRKLQDCWQKETCILGYRLAFCVKGVTPKSPKPSKLTHFTLKHFQGSCF